MKILDAIYSTRITLEGLATRYGMKHEEWPEAVLESLKARHNQIYSQIEDQICSLGGAYHPLGNHCGVYCLYKVCALCLTVILIATWSELSRDSQFDSNMIRTSSRFGNWMYALTGAYHPLGKHSDASRAYLHCVCALLWVVDSSMVRSIASLGSRPAPRDKLTTL